MLVDVLIRHDLPFDFGRQLMARVAACPVLELELDHRVRKHLFKAVALDLPRGERPAANDDR